MKNLYTHSKKWLEFKVGCYKSRGDQWKTYQQLLVAKILQNGRRNNANVAQAQERGGCDLENGPLIDEPIDIGVSPYVKLRLQALSTKSCPSSSLNRDMFPLFSNFFSQLMKPTGKFHTSSSSHELPSAKNQPPWNQPPGPRIGRET